MIPCLTYSTALEQKDRELSDVKVDKVFALVRDVGSEASTHDHVPGRVVLLVELFLDVAGDVSLDVVSVERLVGDVDGVGLHFFGHIRVFYNRLSICHYICLLNFCRINLFFKLFTNI